MALTVYELAVEVILYRVAFQRRVGDGEMVGYEENGGEVERRVIGRRQTRPGEGGRGGGRAALGGRGLLEKKSKKKGGLGDPRHSGRTGRATRGGRGGGRPNDCGAFFSGPRDRGGTVVSADLRRAAADPLVRRITEAVEGTLFNVRPAEPANDPGAESAKRTKAEAGENDEDPDRKGFSSKE